MKRFFAGIHKVLGSDSSSNSTGIPAPREAQWAFQQRTGAHVTLESMNEALMAEALFKSRNDVGGNRGRAGTDGLDEAIARSLEDTRQPVFLHVDDTGGQIRESLFKSGKNIGNHGNKTDTGELDEAIARSLEEPIRPASPPASSRVKNTDDDGLAEALQHLSETVGRCFMTQGTEEQFVDPDFPPTPISLYLNGKCRRQQSSELLVVKHFEKERGQDIIWLRPGKILQRRDDLMLDVDSAADFHTTARQFAQCVTWKVFHNNPHPTDVSQGGLGNCWFCGALAAIAEKPELVKRLFVDECSRHGDLSPVGAFLVRLCDGGQWKFVLVDDNLPCNIASMLAYSGARRNQLWAPLIEKSYAKLRGCYEATEGGSPAEGLQLLSGWPSITVALQSSREGQQEIDRATWFSGDVEQARYNVAMRVRSRVPFVSEETLWPRLVSARNADLVMCGSCGHVHGISKEQYREVGLSPSHCYSIVQVKAALGGTIRLIQLRNPWGTGLKWKGVFSDDDTESWTPEVRKEVNATDLGKDGGLFWMSLSDVRRYFTAITICPYRAGWSERRIHSRIPRSLLGTHPGFLVSMPSAGTSTELLLSLMQETGREEHETADLGMVLFRVSSSDVPNDTCGERVFGSSALLRKRLVILDSVSRDMDKSLCDHFLEQRSGGGLLVVPLSFNFRDPVQPGGIGGNEAACDKAFTFSCYSAHQVLVRALQLSPCVVRAALVAHVKRNGTVALQSHRSEAKLWKLEETPGVVLYFENTSSAPTAVQVGFKFVNMVISRGADVDYDGSTKIETFDIVPSRHGMVVFIATALPGGCSYNLSLSLKGCFADSEQATHVPQLAEPEDPMHDPMWL